ncbi:hypothetical protein EF919_18210 [Streptomyces sp. WAC02707]|uniref:hypothetical protein n=1 Tax=Streptomyces TaxID=1883 RepID=UPI000F7965CD|nr:hypothetical protein [Streptomyces sp. WAC02707]RSS92468.1 hypothetical protein EF919_18210 [Streptomyces sp. WAC02707]
MSALPERYQRYVQPEPRPVHGEVELQAERDPIVWVPDAYGEMVPMRRSHAPAPPAATVPRDLTPQPVLDPLAQRMAAAGVGAGAAGAGVGWGIGQAAAGVASIGGTTAVVVMLALWLLARASRPSVQVRQTVHNHATWWGKNTTNLG